MYGIESVNLFIHVNHPNELTQWTDFSKIYLNSEKNILTHTVDVDVLQLWLTFWQGSLKVLNKRSSSNSINRMLIRSYLVFYNVLKTLNQKHCFIIHWTFFFNNVLVEF